MQSLFAKPKAVYTVLVVAMVGLFALSAVGNTGEGAKQRDDGWKDVVGGIGWWGFCLAFLLTIGFSVALLVRRTRRSRIAT
jgi:hypothetical protein